jgi:hypothetical protein
MEEIMTILQTANKRRMLNTVEKFHIYSETKKQNQINDRHTVFPNVIFDELLRQNRKPVSATWLPSAATRHTVLSSLSSNECTLQSLQQKNSFFLPTYNRPSNIISNTLRNLQQIYRSAIRTIWSQTMTQKPKVHNSSYSPCAQVTSIPKQPGPHV